jgi:hypothetical protein
MDGHGKCAGFAARLVLVLGLVALIVLAVAYLLTYGLPPVVLAGLVSGPRE